MKNYWRWVFRIRRDQKMPYWQHNIRCGLHSGLPLCCVLFFTFLWFPLSWGEWHARYRKLITAFSPPGGGIRCPFCLTFGKPLRMKPCHCYDERRKHGPSQTQNAPVA